MSEVARKKGSLRFVLRVLYYPMNQGYGGNQKIGFHYPIEEGFDYVALVHGDGQDAPECLLDLVRPIAEGEADASWDRGWWQGRGTPRLPPYRYVGNKVLTGIQNRKLVKFLLDLTPSARSDNDGD